MLASALVSTNDSSMQYLVTNFAYGYGPFLRTTELALAVNQARVAIGKEPLGMIVPWVYGEKQRQIMLEEFASSASLIFLDEKLGEILRRVFYADSSYEEALRAWVERFDEASADARAHLESSFTTVSLEGKTHRVEGSDILFAIARAPRVSFAPIPSYSATFGHISEILEQTLKESGEDISVDRSLVRRAIPIAKQVEEEQELIGLGTPGTFTHLSERMPLENEISIPPTITTPSIDSTDMAPGIYVTITGIPGLERLYAEARALGLTIYTNDPDRLPGSVRAHPDVIGNPAIKLSFARAGWGSIWRTQLVNKPIVVPAFDPKDDPEIFFNNRSIEALGLGIVYTGQPLQELATRCEALIPQIEKYNNALFDRFGTLDGNALIASKIVLHLSRNDH